MVSDNIDSDQDAGLEPTMASCIPPEKYRHVQLAPLPDTRRHRPLLMGGLIGGLALLLLGLGSAVAYRNVQGGHDPANSSDTLSALLVPSPTATLTPTATPTFTPTPLPPTATPTLTPTPTPTLTPTPTPARPPANSPPTHIVIPKIGVDSKVVEVGWTAEKKDGQLISVWNVADYAAGFHRDSAYPGHIGNTVLSGHHNIKGEVFRYVVDLEPGDEVILYVEEMPYRYAVEEKLILPDKYVSAEQKRENGKWIRYFPEERLTLVTCWPYTNNTHRVIVIAKPLLDEG
jgi:sortase A